MLYLLPTPLAEGTAPQVLPPQVVAAVARLPYFLVENLRTARRFVKEVAPHRVIEDIRFELIDKDSTPAQVRAALAPLAQQPSLEAGVLGEAGCPGIADPGAALAQAACGHLQRHRHRPLPSRRCRGRPRSPRPGRGPVRRRRRGCPARPGAARRG